MKAICFDPFTHVKSYKIWTLLNKNFQTLPWSITSRSSKVVCTDQTQQNWCYSLITRTDRPRWNTVWGGGGGIVRVHVEIETVNFPSNIFGRAGEQKPTRKKAHQPNMSPPHSRNLDKSPPTPPPSPFMSPFVLTTPGHPSHHLFTLSSQFASRSCST